MGCYCASGVASGVRSMSVAPLGMPGFSDIVNISDVNDDAGRQRCENRAITRAPTTAIDRNGLCDSYCAEAARVERADLAVLSGLGDRASICLARGRAAARVGVIANAGHPCAGGLCLSHGSDRQRENRDGQNIQSEADLTHDAFSFWG